MWRPRTVGVVVAQRSFLTRHRGRRSPVAVRFGRPVRAAKPERGDPWWCPVEIEGLGPKTVRSIAGEDSLQALVLALEFAATVLPVEAQRSGMQLEWLGERERLVFADTLARGLANRALQSLAQGLADAIGVLDAQIHPRSSHTRRMLLELKALVASGGHSRDLKVTRPNRTQQGEAKRRSNRARG